MVESGSCLCQSNLTSASRSHAEVSELRQKLCSSFPQAWDRGVVPKTFRYCSLALQPLSAPFSNAKQAVSARGAEEGLTGLGDLPPWP
jgi:hypothetical protein